MLVAEQSELARVTPLTLVSVQSAVPEPHVMDLDVEDRAILQDTLFDADLTERMLHDANMREGQPIREVRIEARSVSAHARLAAALKERGADPPERRPEAMAVNARSISAGEALKVLDQGWTAQAEGGLQVSWMLHGRPGVGKTELVQTLAERKGASLYDLRLTTIEPQDLRGLPFYDHEKGRTVWYRPEDLPDDPDRPAILFLDELTAAAPTLQPTVYGLLQERRVGRHRLPDSVFIVAAGNMVEDGAIAYEMGTALSDRLIHVIVQADADDWLKIYAPGAGIHPAVAAFLAAVPTCWKRPRTRFAGATPSPAPPAAGPG
jgi:hypothetical protein